MWGRTGGYETRCEERREFERTKTPAMLVFKLLYVQRCRHSQLLRSDHCLNLNPGPGSLPSLQSSSHYHSHYHTTSFSYNLCQKCRLSQILHSYHCLNLNPGADSLPSLKSSSHYHKTSTIILPAFHGRYSDTPNFSADIIIVNSIKVPETQSLKNLKK